jgi:UTP-glucose-1-phosphate uridylyltransferase
MTERKDGVKQAVIMAGGEGTRLKPLTNTRPKPLLPVLGRPCIEYVINSLASAGVEEIFIACGYRSQDIVNSLGDTTRYGAKITYAYEEVPMGTAGAVKLLQDKLHGTFLVGSGDTLTDADLGHLIDFHREKKAFVTMALTEVEKPEQFGIVGVNADGRIERFKEKPRTEEVFSNVINAGTYVLEADALRDQVRFLQEPVPGPAGQRQDAVRLPPQRVLEGHRPPQRPVPGQHRPGREARSEHHGPGGALQGQDSRFRIYRRRREALRSAVRGHRSQTGKGIVRNQERHRKGIYGGGEGGHRGLAHA